MHRDPPAGRPNHVRLVRTAAALSVGTVLGSAALAWGAWEATREAYLARVLNANLDVARVLAHDLADAWGPGAEPASFLDLHHYWTETEPLYRGSMEVMGTDGTVIFDSAEPARLGIFVAKTPLPVEAGPRTLGELAAAGEDWSGVRTAPAGAEEAVAFANVRGHAALVSVSVPYAAVLAEVRDAALPWAGALAAVAVGAGPVSLLLLHRAWRLSVAETARAEAALERYAARLRTLQQVDRAILGARSTAEVALAGLNGIAAVIPLRRAWVRLPGEDRPQVVASFPAGAASEPPADAALVRVPFGGGPTGSEGDLVVDVGTADALAREDHDVLAEVADVLSVALRQARLHEAVARHATDLGVRVEERTAELQEAVREMEGFNYTVAHDLRAPLRSMAGLADVVRLEEATLAPRSVALLSGISESAQRLDRLVTDLLAYARIAREDTPPVGVDLDAAVVAAVTRARGELGRAEAGFTIDHPLPPVLATPLLLDQVLANLLSNAVKFVPPERVPQIRVRAVRSGGQVRVEVRDNGIGVEVEHHERIFRVFERLHGKVYPGTGVGLAIVRRAVERMGGAVGVERDETSGGSIFWFVLPAEERHARSEEDRVAGGR